MTLADFGREFRLHEMEKQAYMLKTVCFNLSKSPYIIAVQFTVSCYHRNDCGG